MLDRRQLLAASAASLTLPWTGLQAQPQADLWGAGQGYPIGLAGGLNRERYWRVGNYSGGYEKLFPFHTIRAAGTPMPWVSAPRSD
ncbi:MAG: 6-aminohexanoate-dimer hydrolase, partial [Pseudomonadota bacterium]